MEEMMDWLDIKTPINYAQYVDKALYHPEFGYYTKKRQRVGFDASSDFYTSSSLGTLFGELILGSLPSLFPDLTLNETSFVEIGAENRRSILDGLEHPFKKLCPIDVRSPLEIPDPSIVFSNELFDAQPFHRVIFRNGEWRELGLVSESASLKEMVLETFSDPVQSISHHLPKSSIEGYIIDIPLAAIDLLDRIASQTWSGAFVAFDYGLDWQELCELRPSGTARAYQNHEMTTDLLETPGERDLTCHICWDWMEAILLENKFSMIQTQTQERFLLHNAQQVIESIISGSAGVLDKRKATLMELLHPSNMGRKFQVLTAYR